MGCGSKVHQVSCMRGFSSKSAHHRNMRAGMFCCLVHAVSPAPRTVPDIEEELSKYLFNLFSD